MGISDSERDRRCQEIIKNNVNAKEKVDKLYDLFKSRYGIDDSAKRLFMRIVAKTEEARNE
jgi:hypothetical protein